MHRLVVCAVVTCLPVLAGDSALDIVKRSLERQNQNWQRQKDYTYQSREVVRETDSNGRVTSTKVRKYDVMMMYQRPYIRLVGKDDKPLSASEESKQEDKARKEMEK